MKPTKWLTNSEAIAKRLLMTCPGGHQHELLLDGKAKQCQVYPPAVCEAIVQGLRLELEQRMPPCTSIDDLGPVDEANQPVGYRPSDGSQSRPSLYGATTKLL